MPAAFANMFDEPDGTPLPNCLQATGKLDPSNYEIAG